MRKSIAAYLTGLLVLALAVFQFNQYIDRHANRELTLSKLEAYLDHKQVKSDQDALLYLMIGNLYAELESSCSSVHGL